MAIRIIDFATGFQTDENPASTVSADNIAVTPSGDLSSTTVQAALVELQTDIDTAEAAHSSHTGASAGAHAASAISNTPSGNLSATTVQGALNEIQTDLDTHKSDAANPHSVTKTQVGLGNVDNTSDMNKPVSTAQAAADAAVLSSAQSYANAAVASLVDSSPTTLDTLNELAAALGDDPNFATTTATALGNRLRVDTAAQGLTGTEKTNAKTNVDLQNVDNTSDANKPVSTATQTALNLKANLASPTFTGTVTLPTATTITNPTLDDGATFLHEATPSTPSSGRVRVYSKSDNSLYVLDSSGVETQVGSGGGSGSGTLNIVDNPSATSSTTGWTAASNYTVSRDTSNSPLAGIIDSCFAISTTTASSETSTSGVYAASLAMPAALRNTKAQVKVYLTVPASSLGVWRMSVYNASGTRMSLSSDSSSVTTLPAGFTGVYTATFDADSSATYTSSFTQTTRSSANTLYATGIEIGNGITAQGAAISEVQSWTPTGSWVSNTTYTGRFTRFGRWALMEAKVECSGAPTATALTITMPSGMTIDTSAMVAFVSTDDHSFGTGSAVDSGTANYQVRIGYQSATVLRVFAATAGGSYTAGASVTASVPFTFGANDSLSLRFWVPIAEWAGNGTVNLGQGAQVEYAFNTSTSTSASDTSSFGYGPQGAQIQNLTAGLARRVRFQYPVQADDLIVFEVSTDRTHWYSLDNAITGASGGLVPWQTQNGETYGAGRLYRVNSTDIDVAFGRYAYTTNTTFGGAGQAYSVDAGSYYWRVRKAKASSPVGFGMAAEGVSGLISSETTGTFTATVTGMTAGTTGTVRYTRTGKTVTLYIPGITGTSNTTSQCTMTGLPAIITPQRQQAVLGTFTDNGSQGLALHQVTASGTIFANRFTAINSITGGVTGSGTKGFPEQTFTYSLD
jgi:hypothetical protein